MNIEQLSRDCAVYLTDRNAEALLAHYQGVEAPTEEVFLMLLDSMRPSLLQARAGLFELWLRAEPKPRGGRLLGMHRRDELPLLHWLLREQVAEVFGILAQKHHDELQKFVVWFLDKAREHTRYFGGKVRHSPSTAFNYSRSWHTAWALLAKEVQAGARSLGISFPRRLRVPAMPTIEVPRKQPR